MNKSNIDNFFISSKIKKFTPAEKRIILQSNSNLFNIENVKINLDLRNIKSSMAIEDVYLIFEKIVNIFSSIKNLEIILKILKEVKDTNKIEMKTQIKIRDEVTPRMLEQIKIDIKKTDIFFKAPEEKKIALLIIFDIAIEIIKEKLTYEK